MTERPDAIVVGAGPNGLTAAIRLARAGLSVVVYEAAARVGGGARTEELTIPGLRHDTCSAVHPLGAGSPAFGDLPLDRFGLEWVHPDLPLAHPFLDGGAAVLARSTAETECSLGGDAGGYRRLVAPFLGRWDALAADVLRPPWSRPPSDALLLARFGVRAAAPAAVLARLFRRDRARGLLAGLAAHAMARLTAPGTGGIALLFALAAHAGGWPFPRGGAQALSDALAGYLRSLGGRIETGHLVRALAELPPARAYLLDVAPEAAARIAGDRLPRRYAERLRRHRRGPGVFKVDYALSEPVPWTAEECRRAGTIHLGPSLPEIGSGLHAVYEGRPPSRPFLIAAQPGLFDDTRGGHLLWVYAHVPNGWSGDLTPAIEAQIERFAPGFADVVVAAAPAGPAAIEARNPNYRGGDIAVGRTDGFRLLVRVPYATPNPSVYLCSSATAPGPGVHGMCGFNAAGAALRHLHGAAKSSGSRLR